MFGGYSIRFAEDLLGGEMGAESMIELGRRSTKPLVISSLYAPITAAGTAPAARGGLPVRLPIEHAVSAQGVWRARHLPARCRSRAPAPAARPTAETRSPKFVAGKERGRISSSSEAEGLAAGPWGAGGA